MPKYTVHATVSKDATFAVEAANEDEALMKVKNGDWLEEASQDQVTDITPHYAEEDTA